jgi:predicted Zn-dependent protease
MAADHSRKVLRGLAACCAVAVGAAGIGVAQAARAGAEDAFQTLLHRGFDLHQQAKFAEAIPVLEQARRLSPSDYFVNLLLGIDLLRTGKPADAAIRLKLAARVKPSEEFPEDYLGEAEATLGDSALAAEAFEQAVARGHDSEQSLEAWAGFALERFREIGEQLRASNEGLAVARRLQQDAVSTDTGAGPRGACAASIPALERRLAVTAAHWDVETAGKLSVCYATEAGIAAGKLQAGGDDPAAVDRLRGDVLLRLKGDAAAAEAEYRQGLAVHPSDPELLERLAEAQLSAGDAEGARQSAKAALAVDPHRRAALHTLAELAMSDRDYAQAMPYLRQLAAEAPNDRADQVQLGRALAQTGEPAEALQWLQPALAAGYPDEKGALHALAAGALRKLGRDAEADKAAAEARRLSDSFQARSAHADGPDAN